MIKSEIRKWNGRPTLYVNEKIVPACAYMTYFPERNRYRDFAQAGYQMFSVNASFTSLPINSTTGFAPLVGIFDNLNVPDYTAFDREVEELIRICPKALIFPRVYVSMPQWWIDTHEEETVETADGKRRELLYSDAFRSDGGKLLTQFIQHVRQSEYAEHIFGYQIAGGHTQEWLHFFKKNPLQELYDDKPYLEFLSHSVADTISYFARIVKEETRRQQIVGAFYGYTMEVTDPMPGTHGMEYLLKCPDIDFFSSPVSYKNGRALGIDWIDMTAISSIQLHNKMYFVECDIRTYLSDYPENCRPGVDSKRRYTSAIWKGPDTLEKSVSAVRKAYARQLIHGNGLWWFDMWGGWYENPALMEEMRQCHLFMQKVLSGERKEAGKAEAAMYIDETMYRRIPVERPCIHAQAAMSIALGQTGVPYDTYLLCDLEECENYRAIILPVAYDSPATIALKKKCEEKQIPVLQCTPEHWQMTPDELRYFFKEADVWCYCESNDVFGLGNGFFYLHAIEDGTKIVDFPTGKKMTFEMQQYETLIYDYEEGMI